MALKEKLIQWGWINKHDRSLTWRHWQERIHRQPITYLRNDQGKPTPIYDIFKSGFIRGKAA